MQTVTLAHTLANTRTHTLSINSRLNINQFLNLFLSSMFPPCRACSSRLLQTPRAEKAVGVGSIVTNHFGRPHAAACRHVYLQTCEEHMPAALWHQLFLHPAWKMMDMGNVHGEKAIDYLAAAR